MGIKKLLAKRKETPKQNITNSNALKMVTLLTQKYKNLEYSKSSGLIHSNGSCNGLSPYFPCLYSYSITKTVYHNLPYISTYIF